MVVAVAGAEGEGVWGGGVIRVVCMLDFCALGYWVRAEAGRTQGHVLPAPTNHEYLHVGCKKWMCNVCSGFTCGRGKIPANMTCREEWADLQVRRKPLCF